MNGLFERIGKRGLQSAEFRLDEKNDVTYVRHLPTGSFFSMGTSDGVLYGGSTKIGEYGAYPYGNGYWADILNAFDQWLHNVRLEAETPNMWAELRRVREIAAGTQRENEENTPFTPNEQAQISAQLREIKESVKRLYTLSDEQLTVIDAKLEEAEDASHYMGRKDWRILFLGLILPLVVSGFVTPDIVHHIIVMVFSTIGHLFGGGAPPELPPQA